MKKYRVETDIIEGIAKGEQMEESRVNDYLDIGCPESWFSPVEEEVTEGQYWKWNSSVYRIDLVADLIHAHNISSKSDRGSWDKAILLTEMTLLDDDAVEEALITEAKRRGFTTGNKARDLDTNHTKVITSGKWVYSRIKDALFYCGLKIYQDGKFASIIDEPIQINGYEAEFKDGYVQFGCAKVENSFFVDLAKCIKQEALDSKSMIGNRVIEGIKIGEGLFTLEDIKKIAKRIES